MKTRHGFRRLKHFFFPVADGDPKKCHQQVILRWKHGGVETEVKMQNATVGEALCRAKDLGYKDLVWYKPWQYCPMTIFTFNSCQNTLKKEQRA